MTTRVFIRTAGNRDVEAIRALLTASWHATYDAIYGVERVNEICASWHASDRIAQNVQRPDGEFLVADDGECLLGVAFATAAEEGRLVTLHQLYVRADAQGHGIGGELLAEIEGSFHDAALVRLEVEERNARAVAFYIGQGFVESGRADHCGGDSAAGIPALKMEKPIVWMD